MAVEPARHPARELAGALEPVAAQVYFAPECHARYEALGFGPSPAQRGGVALPDGPAYFCSRGSVMGQVPGELIAAAFAVFNPAVVVPAVDHGWALTDATTLCAARTEGAVACLTRLLGEHPDGLDRVHELLVRANQDLRPEGRPLHAGLRSLDPPGTPLGDTWRLADQLREYRGDAHTAAWTSAGLDATEIGLLSELYWGLPSRSYVRTRAWSPADLDAAEIRLEQRGLMADHTLTVHGREVREAVELATDLQCEPIVDALGDDLHELVALLAPWGRAVRSAGGYPAAGPHDLAAPAG
ncbi:MAG: SCO6745 family protein [Microthrixaceae bacterium]